MTDRRTETVNANEEEDKGRDGFSYNAVSLRRKQDLKCIKDGTGLVTKKK